MKPMPAKPTIIMAHVDGSGTALTTVLPSTLTLSAPVLSQKISSLNPNRSATAPVGATIVNGPLPGAKIPRTWPDAKIANQGAEVYRSPGIGRIDEMTGKE